MVTIIDYGVGNINAFVNIYKSLGLSIRIARTITDLDVVNKIILPGVGSFDHAMSSLNNSGLRDRLDNLVLLENVPVLGVCVGMQMMAKNSQEGKEFGLGWLEAEVFKFDLVKNEEIRILPHMGWNDVKINLSHRLFQNLESNSVFYFLHSYYIKCKNPSQEIAQADYGINFGAAINYNNIYGVQFHPEKSHQSGETLLKNFYFI